MVVLAPQPPQSALEESLTEAAAVRVEGVAEAERVPLVSSPPFVSVLRRCRQQPPEEDGLHVFSNWPAVLPRLSESTATYQQVIGRKDNGRRYAMNGRGCMLQVHESVEESTGTSTAAVEQGAGGAALGSAHFWDFVRDGLNMLVRSATLQVACCDAWRCMLALTILSHS